MPFQSCGLPAPADGYGRMAGKPALTLLHLGPGLGNALANLHNARRAGTPLVNLVGALTLPPSCYACSAHSAPHTSQSKRRDRHSCVITSPGCPAGDMATWHHPADPLLNSDIPALAGTVSSHTHVCVPGEDLGAAMAAAVAAATCTAGSAGGSRVVTLVVPHDLSWERGEAAGHHTGTKLGLGGPAACTPAATQPSPQPRGPLPQAVQGFVRGAAAALRACPRGKAALYIAGRAALAQGARCGGAAWPGAVIGCALCWWHCNVRTPQLLPSGHAAPSSAPQAARWKAAGASPPPRAPRCCARMPLRGWTAGQACPAPPACPTSRRQASCTWRVMHAVPTADSGMQMPAAFWRCTATWHAATPFSGAGPLRIAHKCPLLQPCM